LSQVSSYELFLIEAKKKALAYAEWKKDSDRITAELRIQQHTVDFSKFLRILLTMLLLIVSALTNHLCIHRVSTLQSTVKTVQFLCAVEMSLQLAVQFVDVNGPSAANV
jgi:ABC-type long-subunit fatty acid transport system fused permease/ATPase subunit